MNRLRTAALVLLAAVCAVGADGPRFGPGASGWGPSWVGSGPALGNARPEKLGQPVTAVSVADDRSEIGVSVRIWADAEVTKGHTYQLLYQLRVQTRPGEMGSILGSADKPSGIAFPVRKATADARWNGLETRADINRKDITGMTNLPVGNAVALRVEPHLSDETAGKFITPGKTRALIVVADVAKSGQVNSVTSLRAWIAANARYNAEKVLKTLAGMDEYDLEGNGLGEALGAVLAQKDIPAATKVRFIRAVPTAAIHPKSPTLWGALNALAAGDEPELKAAAKAKLAEKK